MARSAAEDGPHPVDRYVGRRVADRRISMGFNQSDLGRALGLTFQQVQKYEKGSNRISSSKLWDISQFLDVDVAYFFEGLSETTRSPGTSSDQDYPSTRQTVEMARLAPTLTSRQQRLTLDLMRALAGADLDET